MLAAAAGLAVGLVGCTAAGHPSAVHSSAVDAAAAATPGAPTAPPGRWYVLGEGRPRPIDSPAAAKAPYEPWTVQTRVSGMLSIDSTLYLAVNGWGVVALSNANRAADGPSQFREFENRRLFGERTINGFAVQSGTLIFHLYRNTVFATKSPSSPPVTYARFVPAVGRMTRVVLPLSHEGWEAVAVVTTARGRWALAWKKTSAQKVVFRYVLYDPADGKSATIDRDAFLAAFDFVPMAKAPIAVRRLSGVVAALEAPSGTAGSGVVRVIHVLLRSAPFDRTRRYTEGPETALSAGDAALVAVPAIRADKHIYALISRGRIVRTGAGAINPSAQEAFLPPLPAGYAYTDFWTDGHTLVAAWEQQRFAEVGAAGLYLVAARELMWSNVR